MESRLGQRTIRQNSFHRVCGTAGGSIVVMGIPLERERCGRVSNQPLEIAGGLATLGEWCSARVPEIVEPDSRESCPLQERFEVPVDHVLSFEGAAVLGGEHEPAILPLPTRSFSSSWRLRWLLRALTAI